MSNVNSVHHLLVRWCFLKPLHAHLPAFKRQARIDLLHRNTLVNGANKRTEIAAHTFLFHDLRHVHTHSIWILLAISSDRIWLDTLMRAVFTCDVAELAADAQFLVNIGDDLVIEI